MHDCGDPKIFSIFAGEEVPRMALRVLHATHRTSEQPRVLTTKTWFWYMYRGVCPRNKVFGNPHGLCLYIEAFQ